MCLLGVYMKKKTVCLNMIVRNEIRVIRRCLASLRKFIDYWVIVDTGSEDGTQEAIREALQGIPGELHARPWVDFATCRNEALELARGKADYCLFIDADEIFMPDPGFFWPRFEKDCYFATFLLENGSTIQRLFLASGSQKWSWRGALHEELTTDEPRTGSVLEGAHIAVIQDGRRSLDPKKHLRDAEMLERELLKSPECKRTLFYLAISYEMAQLYAKALQAFQERSRMGGWDEEVYYSLYRSGCLLETLGQPKAASIASFCKAFEACPHRAEPLFLLCKIFNEGGAPWLAYLLACFGLRLPQPADRTFVEQEVYDYKLLIQKADAASLQGRLSEAIQILKEVLTKKTLPKEKRFQIETALSRFLPRIQ